MGNEQDKSEGGSTAAGHLFLENVCHKCCLEEEKDKEREKIRKEARKKLQIKMKIWGITAECPEERSATGFDLTSRAAMGFPPKYPEEAEPLKVDIKESPSTDGDYDSDGPCICGGHTMTDICGLVTLTPSELLLKREEMAQEEKIRRLLRKTPIFLRKQKRLELLKEAEEEKIKAEEEAREQKEEEEMERQMEEERNERLNRAGGKGKLAKAHPPCKCKHEKWCPCEESHVIEIIPLRTGNIYDRTGCKQTRNYRKFYSGMKFCMPGRSGRIKARKNRRWLAKF